MKALPTLLKALTKRAAGKAAWSRSMSESLGLVKKRRTPSTGGSSPMGFVVSITSLPLRLRAPNPAEPAPPPPGGAPRDGAGCDPRLRRERLELLRAAAADAHLVSVGL